VEEPMGASLLTVVSPLGRGKRAIPHPLTSHIHG
jgi:hypothetical protein